MTTFRQLKIFWDKANTTTNWKLRVFKAIMHSKLMYSLEVIQLTQNDLNKLDAFQMKALRRILKIPSTFIDRAQTDQVVLQTANTHGVYVQKLSDFWRQRKISLLGHIVRADANDPLRQVIFENQTCIPRKPPYRRQGRPRVDWLTETVKDTFHCLGHSPPQEPSLQDIRMLQNAARNRAYPF